MNVNGRVYSDYADDVAVASLEGLLNATHDPILYQSIMTTLGKCLGKSLNVVLPADAKCLVVSTAEDADYLTSGVIETIASKHPNTLAAVFWNNHQDIPGGSIAPIVHKFIQPGYESSNTLIVIKSVISGGCVVRTNILALVEKLNLEKIYILSPVMHSKAAESLASDFPEEISSKFEFVYFAQDSHREDSGQVVPGIGGEVYRLLGIGNQPVLNGYMPSLVRRLASV